MHRLMVLSTAYRQSSRATPEQAAKAVTADPQNKLLHRQNVRRLEAEAIRDAHPCRVGAARSHDGRAGRAAAPDRAPGRSRPAGERAARRQRPAQHLPRGAAELPEPDVHRVRLPDAVHHHRPAHGVERAGAGARDAEQPVRAAAGGAVGEANARGAEPTPRSASQRCTRPRSVARPTKEELVGGDSGSSRSRRRSTASRTTRRRGPTSPTSSSTPRSSSSWSDRTLEKPVFPVAILFLCIQALSLPLCPLYLPNRLEILSFLHFRRGRVATEDRNSLWGLSIYMATCGHAS